MDKFIKQLRAALPGVDQDELEIESTRKGESKNVFVTTIKFHNLYFTVYSQTDDNRLLNLVIWKDKSQRSTLTHISPEYAIDAIATAIKHRGRGSYVDHLNAKAKEPIVRTAAEEPELAFKAAPNIATVDQIAHILEIRHPAPGEERHMLDTARLGALVHGPRLPGTHRQRLFA